MYQDKPSEGKMGYDVGPFPGYSGLLLQFTDSYHHTHCPPSSSSGTKLSLYLPWAAGGFCCAPTSCQALVNVPCPPQITLHALSIPFRLPTVHYSFHGFFSRYFSKCHCKTFSPLHIGLDVPPLFPSTPAQTSQASLSAGWLVVWC